MSGQVERTSSVWRLEPKVVLTDEVPAAALVSVAFAAGEHFAVVRGDVAPVVGRPSAPERDIAASRLRVSLELGGLEAGQRSSRTSGTDRESWQTLLRWEGPDPASDLRVVLELDDKTCEYVLALVD